MAAKAASKVSFEDFTSTTMDSIIRAIDANQGSRNPLVLNPHIIIGIVWAPQLQEFQTAAKKQS